MKRRFLRFRNFHTKLFISYSIIIIVLTLAVSMPMYYYLKNNLMRNQNAVVEKVFNNTTERFDQLESQYDNFTKQLYLFKTVDSVPPLSVIEQLLTVGNHTDNTFRVIQSLRNAISLGQEVNKNLYRINLIVNDGILYSSSPTYANESEVHDLYDTALRLSGAVDVHYYANDPFEVGNDSNMPTFSLSRLLQSSGQPAGVLQALVHAKDIVDPEELAAIPFDRLTIFNRSDPIYSYPDSDSEKAEVNEAAKLAASVDRYPLHADGKLIFYRKSESDNFAFYMTVPIDRIYKPIRNFRWVMILIVSFILTFSILIYYFLARILTAPLQKIRTAFDAVQLSDDDNEPEYDLSQHFYNDEIERLNRSFRKMNTRLQHSLNEIVKFHKLQLQSQFDLLQSQINPHFLFNMLGVIQVLSDHKESELASRLCVQLAEFMRYAIATKQTKVTLKEEFEITEMYLQLMKSRYQHRLEFRVGLQPAIADSELPKLVLQPFVENSIQHGFKHIKHPMLIEIDGRIEDNRIVVEVKDNGSGFNLAIKQQLYDTMARQHANLSRKEGHETLSIGGMGIVSTFLRLKLLLGESVELRIEDLEGQGTLIRIEYTRPSGKEVRP